MITGKYRINDHVFIDHIDKEGDRITGSGVLAPIFMFCEGSERYDYGFYFDVINDIYGDTMNIMEEDIVEHLGDKVLNNSDSYESIEVRLSPEKTPIAYGNKVECLISAGHTREEAEKVALEPIDLELYYEIGHGLMAVEAEAVEAGTIYSPYSKTLYKQNEK